MSRCPKCGGQDTVQVEQGLQARPIGSFSLAGAQMKFSAREVAIATCTTCDLHLVGHLELDTAAGKTYFVATSPARPADPAG